MDNRDLMKEIPNESIDLIIIDPPYGTSIKRVYARDGVTPLDQNKGDWDFIGTSDILWNLFTMISEGYRVLKPGGAFYIFCSDLLLSHVLDNVQENFTDSLKYRNSIVWVKTNPVPRFIKNTGFIVSHEFIAYFTKGKPKTFRWISGSDGFQMMKSVWACPICSGKERLRLSGDLTGRGKSSHATQKPTKVLSKIIYHSSKPGDVVLDCYCGVGSTGFAAKVMGRSFIGCDNGADSNGVPYVNYYKSFIDNPKYLSIIKDRCREYISLEAKEA